MGLAGAVRSSYLQNMQKLVTDMKWPKSCATCKSRESAGHKSRRQVELESLQPTEIGIQTMDLRVGNVCNLACRMCSPFSSIALLEEWSDNDKYASKVMEESIGAYRKIDWKNWSEMPEVWNDLFDISDQVKEINFAGGEPFLNLAHVSYLKKLIQTGRSQDIQISYNTNLTVIPQWLELMIKSFKQVKVMVSVDGTGDLGAFIRHPLKWSTFETNLAHLDRLKGSYKETLDISFNTTVQIYNLFGLTDLLDYFEKSSLRNLPRTATANLLENPFYFNIANLPSVVKRTAGEKIELFQSQRGNQLHADFLIAVLKQLTVEPPDAVVNAASDEFRSVTGFYDSKRKQNFAKLVPEMTGFLENKS